MFLSYEAPPTSSSLIAKSRFFFVFKNEINFLISLSINIYSNFNSKTSIKIFQKDEIYEEVEKHLLSQLLEYIDHKNFLQSLENSSK